MAEEEKRDTERKKVDESWKDDIKKEGQKLKQGKGEAGEAPLPEADFRSFITGLVMQGLMLLGEIPDPVTKEKKKDLPHAKYIVDTIMMFQEKTKGNLSKEEEGLLEGAIHELQMKYLKLSEYI